MNAEPENTLPQRFPESLSAMAEQQQAQWRKAIEQLTLRTADLNDRLLAMERQQAGPVGEGAKLVEELLGYSPTTKEGPPMPPMVELFTALAGWRATAPEIVQNRTVTNRDGELLYRYADLSALMALVPGLASHGLTVLNFTRQMDDGRMGAVVMLVHANGGAIAVGPWAPRPGEADRLNSVAQREAGALTTARRILLQFLLNVAADEDPDMGPTSMPPARGGRAAPPPLRKAPDGGRPASTAPTNTKPPPGWISREERAKLRTEQEDPAITPERFAEIEKRLGEAPPAAAATTTPPPPAPAA